MKFARDRFTYFLFSLSIDLYDISRVDKYLIKYFTISNCKKKGTTILLTYLIFA